MHILAYIYHWGVSELWEMPRLERQMWVEQVRKQKEAENKEIEQGDGSSNSSSYKESY